MSDDSPKKQRPMRGIKVRGYKPLCSSGCYASRGIEHEYRIRAHRARITREMEALGLKMGNSLIECSVENCISECLTDMSSDWVRDEDGNWYCPQCGVTPPQCGVTPLNVGNATNKLENA